MKKYPLKATHLNDNSKRLNQFKKDCENIENSVGLKTNVLIDSHPNIILGDICFTAPVPSFTDNRSNYLLLLGLISQPLKYGYNTIGRSSKNDLVIDDMYVSRTHCSLLVHSDGRAEVFDTASANGTFVNGISVKQYGLKSGDVIRIGETTIKISLAPNINLN
ncbi:MAG: FHA domain-containing protein [bacterium]|nr:MAG: FHA domain-containing protein [bacterium]